MSSAKQNQHIARLIVGAMTIDGSLDKKEREKVAATLDNIGMGDLIGYVGAAIDNDDGSFSVFEECKAFLQLLGEDAAELTPLVFRVVCDVVASDRFVSSREAAYLSSLSRRLNIAAGMSKSILKQVMAERRGRLEIAGSAVDSQINAHLKELLSFHGAERLVGEASGESIEELMQTAAQAMAEGEAISKDELARALTILGLDTLATMDEAKDVWQETIDTLDLPKMARLGETFVTAAVNRIKRINDAYVTVRKFNEQAAGAARREFSKKLSS